MQALDRGASFDELRSLASLPKPARGALPCSPWSSLSRLSSGSVRKSGTAVKMKRSPVKKKMASTKVPRVRVSASFLEFAERRTNELWEEAEGTGVTGTEVLRTRPHVHTRPPLDVALHHTHTTSRLWQISSQVCREFAARSLG